MIFVPTCDADDAWQRIVLAVASGKLVSDEVRVCTVSPKPGKAQVMR